jgi:hypothetical protein
MSDDVVKMVRKLYFEDGYKVSEILEMYKGKLVYADVKKIIRG